MAKCEDLLERLEARMERAITVAGDHIVRIRQRKKTSEALDQKVWQIWAYARENAEQLDSERHCRMIRKALESAVSSVQGRNEDLAVETEYYRQKNKELTQQAKELKEQVEILEGQVEKVTQELDEVLPYKPELAEV